MAPTGDILLNLWISHLTSQKDFAGVNKLRIFEMEGYSGLPEWAQCDHMPCSEGPSRMRAERRQKDLGDRSREKSERRGDPRLLALKTEEVNPGMWAASESRESKSKILCYELQGVQFYGHLSQTSDLQNREIMSVHLLL